MFIICFKYILYNTKLKYKYFFIKNLILFIIDIIFSKKLMNKKPLWKRKNE